LGLGRGSGDGEGAGAVGGSVSTRQAAAIKPAFQAPQPTLISASILRLIRRPDQTGIWLEENLLKTERDTDRSTRCHYHTILNLRSSLRSKRSNCSAGFASLEAGRRDTVCGRKDRNAGLIFGLVFGQVPENGETSSGAGAQPSTGPNGEEKRQNNDYYRDQPWIFCGPEAQLRPPR